MKLLKYCIIAMTPIASLQAATYTFDDYTVDTPLSNNAGWAASESSTANKPLAWTAPWRGNKAAAIGGWFEAPTASSFSATVATPTALSSSTVSFDMTIKDSTNLYPDRDSFGVTVSDSLGGTLAALSFNPLTQSDVPQGGLPAEWEVSYMVAGGATVNTLISLVEGSEYFMSMTFLDNSFTLTLGNNVSSFSFTENTVGYDPTTQSIGSVSLNWMKGAGNTAYGDNFMLVDNLAVVPEPSVTLLGGIGALFLLRRRRAV